MKPLVIYHEDCTDGFGAAFAAWLKLGDEAEYLPMQYNQKIAFASMVTDRDVYILDFSFNKEQMDFIFSHAKRVVWLDHHKTAFETFGYDVLDGVIDAHMILPLGTRHHVRLDNDKSGALLAWQYFHPGTEIPMLIQHIDDRDRWQFKLEGSKELHAALASVKPWNFEQWKVWCNSVVDGNGLVNKPYAPSGYLFDQGSAILRAQDARIKEMMKQARKCMLRCTLNNELSMPADFHGLALNTPMHMSEVGHELANTSGTYGLVWYLGNDNRAKCSLRSNGDYDVSSIARSFGGGGHRNAAGFETDIETLMGWLE